MGKTLKLWSFQEETVKALKRQKNIILTAPTGTGKTWATLIAFLDGWLKGQPHADKVIYALPLRSLASGLYQSTGQAIERAKKSSLLTAQDKARLASLKITIQTGDQREDPFFKGDICFTTIDQLFTGYLNIPASLPRRLANINAGAWIGALIVIDEVHLLDPERSLATLIEIAKQLDGVAQILLMSATLSEKTIEVLSRHFKAEIISVSESELLAMPGQADKERYYYYIDEPIKADHILDQHEAGRSIVICNTVDRAQKIYGELQRKKPEGCEIILLHSRFLKKDRKKKESRLADYFGPDATKTNIILIATQVIEAGIDISAEVLHTELCPANALLQRAGRCARYAKRNMGKVFVYELEISNSGKERFGPYRSVSGLLNLTKIKMENLSGMNLHHKEEKELIDFVHTDQEIQILESINRKRFSTHQKVLMTISTCDRSQASELVRDIDSVSVYVHDHPEQLDIFKGMELLSIPRTSLFRLEDVFKSQQKTWIAKKPVLTTESDEEDTILWESIKTFKELFTAWFLIINPEFARYDSEIGLVLNEAGVPLTPIIHSKERINPYSYQLETFREHAFKTLKALRFRDSSVVTARKVLSERYGIVEEKLRDLECMLCLLHDTGKLRVQYQEASVIWEIDRYPEHRERLVEPLAHTTFNPAIDYELHRKKIYNRGNHAVEGGYALCESLIPIFKDMFNEENFVEILVVFLTVISKHHSPTAQGLSSGKMISKGEDYLTQVLKYIGNEINISSLKGSNGQLDEDDFKKVLLEPTVSDQWLPLYFYLIRRLRLADQESFEI